MHTTVLTYLQSLQVRRPELSARLQTPNVNAAAVQLSVPVEQLSDNERQQVAHQYGYTKIGKQLPADVTLSQIVKSMPSEVGIAAAVHAIGGGRPQSPTLSTPSRTLGLLCACRPVLKENGCHGHASCRHKITVHNV